MIESFFLGNSADIDRQAARAPGSGLVFEDAGAGGSAPGAVAVFEVPADDVVPVALDEGFAAVVAEGGVAFGIVDVAGVGVADAVLHGDAAGLAQGFGRRGGYVAHFPVGVEGGEVDGDVGTQAFDDPLGHGLKFGFGVVFSGDQQGGDFQPGVGFALDVFQRFQHRLQVGAGEFPVEFFVEGFQVDVGGVHVAEELGAGFGGDVAGGDGDRANAFFAAGLGGVDGVFQEDDRVVVGVGDAAAAELARCFGQLFGGGGLLQRVHFARFAHVPVLAELAGEVAAGGTEREHGGAGKKMVERFFLDRVDAEAARAAVGRQNDLVAFPGANETKPALPFIELAEAGAEIALDSAVVEKMPVTTGKPA